MATATQPQSSVSAEKTTPTSEFPPQPWLLLLAAVVLLVTIAAIVVHGQDALGL